ncbi:MAG TPA: trypsin-like peptidase domain-containing protein [Bdellovibrionota bacterium]|jgi:S1-C subfamily serine protease|nr:trypsin-like peptidase domain-containing protein [Bdellovibrionota bacterium]
MDASARGALGALSDDLFRLVESVSPSVVGVEHRRGSGSGVVIAPDGYLLTNAHVVQKAEVVNVSFHDAEVLEGRVLGRDQKTDLAVVRLNAPRVLKHLPLIDKRRVKVGQIVLAVGNPLRFERSVSWGLVSAIDRTLPSRQGALEGLIQTDAAINPGNSGGPLVSVDGEIVGINTAVVRFAQGIGFAMPAYTASWVVGELIQKGRVQRRYLGIAASGIDLPARTAQRLRVARGVYVHRVESGSPAQGAGLKVGDILLKAETQELWNLDDLQRSLALGTARAIELQILRGKESVTQTVVPAELKNAA